MKRGFLIRLVVFIVLVEIVSFAFYMLFWMTNHETLWKFFVDVMLAGLVVGCIALPILIIKGLLKFVFGKNKE